MNTVLKNGPWVFCLRFLGMSLICGAMLFLSSFTATSEREEHGFLQRLCSGWHPSCFCVELHDNWGKTWFSKDIFFFSWNPRDAFLPSPELVWFFILYWKLTDFPFLPLLLLLLPSTSVSLSWSSWMVFWGPETHANPLLSVVSQRLLT